MVVISPDTRAMARVNGPQDALGNRKPLKPQPCYATAMVLSARSDCLVLQLRPGCGRAIERAVRQEGRQWLWRIDKDEYVGGTHVLFDNITQLFINSLPNITSRGNEDIQGGDRLAGGDRLRRELIVDLRAPVFGSSLSLEQRLKAVIPHPSHAALLQDLHALNHDQQQVCCDSQVFHV